MITRKKRSCALSPSTAMVAVFLVICNSDQPDKVRLPAGISPGQATDSPQLRQRIYEMNETAWDTAAIDLFFSFLEESDRPAPDSTLPDSLLDNYRAAVDSFQAMWSKKYDEPFDEVPLRLNDSILTVEQGTVINPKLISRWPVEAASQSETARSYASDLPQDTGDLPRKGDRVAIAVLSGTATIPLVTASAKHSGDRWYIDIPNRLTPQMVVSNMTKQITEMGTIWQEWPAYPSETIHRTIVRLFMALYGVDIVPEKDKKTDS